MNYDIMVMMGYFSIVLLIALLFRQEAAKSISDYLRGNGKMVWWLVGSTAFMAQFSAWTFTGAAGKAFNDGLAIMAIFVANAIGYGVAWLYFAKRWRQTRVDTPTEIIANRYGRSNELFFAVALSLLSVISAGVWLNGLGVFASAAFGIDINLTITITGGCVLLISLMGGAWGVVASDFAQTLVVAIVSVLCAAMALYQVGGPIEIVNNFPGGFVTGPDMNYPLILVASTLFFIAKQIQSVNNMQDSFRFLNAKDSHHASKGALMAMILMAVGSVIWFIPPWAMAILYPDAAAEYPQFGAKASDTIYLTFAKEYMPVGTVGLLVAGLFAATMSSMDSALNRNAGIFVKSIWLPVKRNAWGYTSAVNVGKVTSLITGLIIILLAQYFTELKELSLFDLMMQVATLLHTPILVPLLLGMIIKITPKWLPWATVVFGMVVSWVSVNVFTPDVIASNLFGIEELTKREVGELKTIITIASHLIFTVGFYLLGARYGTPWSGDIARSKTFFTTITGPVISPLGEWREDFVQYTRVGLATMILGLLMVGVALFPNPAWAKMIFIICAVVIFTIGLFIYNLSNVNEYN